MSKRTVLITGTSSGIGYAQAQAFLALGDTVIGLDKQAATIQHEHFHFYDIDLTDSSALTQLAHELVAQFSIDILLNTAGILDDYTPLLETSDRLWQTTWQTNVQSLFLLTRPVLAQMVAKQQGIIINMASIAGLLAGGGGISYTMAKHAIVGFTKQLAYDYAAKGIRVNAIAPGAIQTPMNAKDFEGDAAMAKWVADETPDKRWGTAQEVANLTVFLASEQASYIQGQIVPIDGGWSIK